MSDGVAGPEAIEAEVIEAEASVIEDGLSSPLEGAERWLAEKRSEAEGEASKYFAYEITSGQMLTQARNERKHLNATRTEIDNDRKAMTKALREAIERFNSDVRDVTSPLDSVIEAYDQRMAEYTGKVVAERREMLREYYEQSAPWIALPAEGSDEPLVGFERLLRRFGHGTVKWLNYSTNDEAARKSLDKALDAMAKAEETIDSMVAEQDRPEVKATYFATLDMGAAMTEAMELKGRRERLARLEDERAALEEDARLAAERAEAERRAEETRSARERAEADYAAGVRTGVLDMPGNRGGVRVTPEQAAALDAVKNGAQPRQAMERPQPRGAAPNIPMPGEPAPATWVFAGYGNEAQAQAFREFCERNGVGRHKEVPTNGRQYKLTTR